MPKTENNYMNFKSSQITFLIFLLSCCLVIFMHLETLPLHLWDESRLAVNALEMSQNGNWIVTYYDGKPDMWNTKPPLMIWLQVIFMKIFGYNELAVRLPSALAGLGTVLLVFFFCKKNLKNKTLGYFSALVLLTTSGYTSNHVTRTGDYDSLFIFWNTLVVFLFFTFIHSENNKRKNLLLYGIALTLTAAVLTKSIMGLVILPPLLFYTIWQKHFFQTIKNPHLYVAIISSLSIIGSYFLLREHYNPGYLEAAWNNDMGGRFLNTLDGNGSSFSFYFRKIYEERFTPWLYFLPLGLLFSFGENEKTKNIILFTFLSGLFFLLVISFSQTKLIWYDAPCFPLWALTVGLSLEKIYEGFKSYFSQKSIPIVFTGFFLVAIFGHPYLQRLNANYANKHLWMIQGIELFEGFIKRNEPLKKFTLLHWSLNGQVTFYKQVYNLKGYEVQSKVMTQFLTHKKNEFGGKNLDFEIGEKVIICEQRAIQEFNKQHDSERLNHWRDCVLLKIVSKKY